MFSRDRFPLSLVNLLGLLGLASTRSRGGLLAPLEPAPARAKTPLEPAPPAATDLARMERAVRERERKAEARYNRHSMSQAYYHTRVRTWMGAWWLPRGYRGAK